MDGWIKLYRKIKDWEWYTDSNVVHVFIHLLLSASFNETKRRGASLKTGQIAISLVLLAAELEKSYPTILRCIRILSESGAIDVKSTNKNTIITIRNFAKYQQDKALSYKNNLEQPLQQLLQQPLQQPLQPIYNKKEKNIKNDKNIINNPLTPLQGESVSPTKKEKSVLDIEPIIAELPAAVQEIARRWVDYKKKQFKFTYKSEISFKAWLKELHRLSKGDINAMDDIVEYAMANSWKGIYELKKSYSNGNNGISTPTMAEKCARIVELGNALASM